MTRRFCFLHSSVNDVISFKKYLKLEGILENVELIWDIENPEILIATEHIYLYPSYWRQFVRLCQKSRLNVFYSVEAMSVDYNLFDIGITYDATLKGDRFCRVLPPEDNYKQFFNKAENEIKTVEQAQKLLPGRKFCNFLYSNWNSHPYRDKLFFIISDYKKVDSLGRHLNNIGEKGTGYVGHANDCIELKSNYKFSIASENAEFPGYTTEKILTSLAAHTVPIYFGNKFVCEDVNPECFINCSDFEDDESLIEIIRELDNNDVLWCEKISQPWFTAEQIERKRERRAAYYDMIQKIFKSDMRDLQFRGEGTAIYNYKDFLYRKGVEIKPIKIMKALLKKKGIIPVYRNEN